MSNKINIVENEKDTVSSHGGMDPKDTNHNMSKMIQLEIAIYVHSYMQQHGGSLTKTNVNIMHESHKRDTLFDGHYASNILFSMNKNMSTIDSEASNHIC